MGYFYDSFMGHRRNQWLRSIHAVEVQTGGSWHRGTINKKKIAAYQQRTITKVEGQGTMIKLTIPIYEVTT